jgi:carbonic anhydrase/acetyltransferase-like protein (isoleucine patch superfamily)
MDTQPRAMRAIETLLDKGVDIPNPLSLDIGLEVDVDRISADNVTIHPGCRIRGERTVISAGVTLGSEGPVTIENCRLGPNVSLKGGYAANAVFLDGANIGLGHQVREGTLLEEEANGAHCVGLKQTILFPFVTLGSLINFCDCLMSGGTSRSNHSEVGSSYVHFNFTPRGDKATASLFGDVARGVMLREPPIFPGAQGGAVGPVTVGYGSVIAAGSVLRGDVPDGQLAIVGSPPSTQVPFNQSIYRDVKPLVAKNVVYIANLRALQEWYQYARAPFFAAQEFGELIYEGTLEILAAALSERGKRLEAMVAKVSPDDEDRARLREHIAELCRVLLTEPLATPSPEELFTVLAQAAASGTPYIAAVRNLSANYVATSTAWLEEIVEELWTRSVALLRLDYGSGFYGT